VFFLGRFGDSFHASKNRDLIPWRGQQIPGGDRRKWKIEQKDSSKKRPKKKHFSCFLPLDKK